MTLDPGAYSVTASRYGYVSQTVSNVQIDEDMIELLDFDLTTASVILLEGVVSDAQAGWALYARIDVAGDPNGPYWTDPESGAFSIVVPTDTVIPLTVTSLVPGYIVDSLNLGPLVSNTVVDIELMAAATSCTAPGYEPGAPLSDGIESFHNDVRGIASCLPLVSGGLIVGQISDMSADGINGAMVDHEDGPVVQTAGFGGPDGEGFYAKRGRGQRLYSRRPHLMTTCSMIATR